MGALFTQPYSGRCGAMGPPFAQPYWGRCGAMGALSPIGGAAALWGHSSLSPIGGAVHSALWGHCSAMGALRRYGAVQPYGGAAALWGGAGPNLWGRKAAPRMCGAAGGAHSAVPRRADVAVAVPAALRAPTVGDVITQ